ncbi:MAG: LysM peptidoglycan-binding domain-containing protein [Kofleriaceae bacterium]
MKRTLVVFGLGIAILPAATAFAQVPIYPGAGTASAPVNLDPSAGGTQAPPPPPTPSQSSNKPNIVVVRPDGSVVNSDDAAGAGASPNGYYVDPNPGAIPLNGNESSVEVHSGTVPELHVVRSGDTLWDICWYYFNDPWQWPKIWSYNAQITNPHWIYPGDLVRLLPRGVFVQTDKEPEKGGDVKPIDRVPPPERHANLGIKQLAFVEQSDLDKSITLDGAVDEKELLGTGDSVYLTYPSNNAPQVGQTYSIYVAGNKVKGHGSYVHILGEVQVVSVKQDKRARGVITIANQEIERGMKVGALTKQFKNVPPVAPAADVQGTIIAKLSGDQLIGEGMIVFIDQGKASGLEVGNRMYVVRRGDGKPANATYLVGQDDKRFPARELGRVLIVEVGDKMSIGLVTISVQEIGVGDTVMQQKQ